MTDDAGDSEWAPPEDGVERPRPYVPRGVADEWAPPSPVRESKMAPPSAAPLPDETVTLTVDTGPVEVTPMPRTRLFGRAMALLAAAALVGSGGYLALNAGSAEGGAQTPQGALEGVLASLSAEDLIGAAEFVEPTERVLLIEAGIDVAAELVRLDVLAADLDLSSIRGIELELDDLELSSTIVAPGLAHVFIDSGVIQGSVDVAQLPLGSLVLDRLPADALEYSATSSEFVNGSDRPVVAVERNGRWYLSLWYSVAENLRLDADQPLPDPSARVVAVGADSPEQAIEHLVDAVVDFDLAAAIGLVDPEEAAALYDYAELFLQDAQRSIADLRRQLREDGWQWGVTDLGLSSSINGDLAEVVVESFALEAQRPGGSVNFRVGADEMRISVIDENSTMEIVSEGECVTTTFADRYESQTDRFCADDLGDLSGFAAGAVANLESLPEAVIVAHQVDGRWYVSPTRTGSNAALAVLAAIEPDALVAAVDAIIDLTADPGAFAGSTGFGPADVELLPRPSPAIVSPAEVPTAENLPQEVLTAENLDLVAGDRERIVGSLDLDAQAARDEVELWAPGTTDVGFSRGIEAELTDSRRIPDPDGDAVVVLVIVESSLPSSELPTIDLIVPGEYVEATVDDPAYVLTRSAYGSPVFAARTERGIVLVGTPVRCRDCSEEFSAIFMMNRLREQVAG